MTKSLPSDQQLYLFQESSSVINEVLSDYKKLWPMLGFTDPVKSLYTYGFGNIPITTARSFGYNMIGAICADENNMGGDQIQQWGCPARPYFVATDDYRKTGNGGPSGMVGLQQEERQTVECRDYCCVYAFDPSCESFMDYFAGITRTRTLNDASVTRIEDLFHCFLNAAGQTNYPHFFCCGLQGDAPTKRQLLMNFVNDARSWPLTFATPTAVAEFYRRHYQSTPESILYLVDSYAGLTDYGKPVNYPDTMEIENGSYKAIFRKGDTLPYVYYDYSIPWVGYPDWGNTTIARTNGVPTPGTSQIFNVTPLMLNTTSFSATSTQTEVSGGTLVNITVTSTVSQPNLALGVWNLPRRYQQRPELLSSNRGTEVYTDQGGLQREPLRYCCREYSARREQHLSPGHYEVKYTNVVRYATDHEHQGEGT